MVHHTCIFVSVLNDIQTKTRNSKKLWLCQCNYIEKVLDKFDMIKVKPMSTSLVTHFKLFLDQCPKSESEIKGMSSVPHASAVSFLMYSRVCTKLNLEYAIGQVSKFMSKPSKQHWEASEFS